MDRSLEFWVFFFVGLVIVAAASMRHFDEPSWPAEDDNRIRGLPPSDIVDRWKFRYAFLVYVLVILTIYSLLCLSARALELLLTAFQVYRDQSPDQLPVGAVFGGDLVENAEGQPSPVELVHGLQEARARPEFPLLVAVALGFLLRFPVAQRAEQFLRRSTHALFGIPAAPLRLHQQALATPVDIQQLDQAMSELGDEGAIARRLDAYATAAQKAIGAGFRRQHFVQSVGKMLAFRYWVAERHAWPSPGTIDDSRTLTEWNRRVQEDIAALERDMALLADPSIVWLPPEADDTQRTLQAKMRQERWEDLVRQTDRINHEVCSLIVLFDQRSALPDSSDPVGSVIDRFLEAIHRADDSRRRVVQTGLWAVCICMAISAAVGFSFGHQLREIAYVTHREAIQNGLAAPDPWAFARDWALTGLIAFGLTTWIAVAWREGLRRRRKWINLFTRRQPLWPIDRWLGVFLVCAVTVSVVYVAYLTTIGVISGADRIADIGRNLLTQMMRNVEIGLVFGAMAGLHGVFVAILLDMGPRELAQRRWIGILGLHAVVLGLAAWGAAQYQSGLSGSTAEVARLRALAQVAAAMLVALVVGYTLVSARSEVLAADDQQPGAGRNPVPPPEHGAPDGDRAGGLTVVPLGRSASLFLIGLSLLAPGAGLTQPAPQLGVEVGMRSDAKPFAYHDGRGPFDGYFVKLCRRAVELAGYSIAREIDLVAQSRFASRRDLDLICDPTTLTITRAEQWDFSPIVFVANATFAEFPQAEPLPPEAAGGLADCDAEPGQQVFGAGMVAGTTALPAFQAARALKGVLAPDGAAAVCPVVVPNHVEGIERLCRGELRYYFGDADILRAYVTEGRDGCAARVLFHPTFRTYEPYAFALPSRDAEFRRRFNRAIYELFTDGEAEAFFAEDPYFAGRPRSEALDLLFRLNRIPRGAAEGFSH